MIENIIHPCTYLFFILFFFNHFIFFILFLHIYKYTCSKANQERPKDGIKKWINSPQIPIYHKLSLMMWPSQAKDPWINVRRIDSGKWHDYPPCNELRMITTRGGRRWSGTNDIYDKEEDEEPTRCDEMQWCNDRKR